MSAYMKTKISLAIFFGVLLLLNSIVVTEVHAAVLQYGGNYTLEDGAQVLDDFYFFGDTLTLGGKNTGDVYTLGSQIITLGDIEEDLVVAGGRVTVGGNVSGDVRVAGGVVQIDGEVGEDLVVAGGNVTIGKDATVKGDLLVFGDRVVVEGVIEGAVRLHVRTAELLGKMNNDVTVVTEESLSVRDSAYIGGNLRYTAYGTVVLSNTVEIAGETTVVPSPITTHENGVQLFWLLFQMCVLIGVTTFFTWAFPAQVKRVSTRAFSDTGWLTFKGFACLFGMPFISIVLMLTIVGIVPALLLFGVFGISVVLAYPLSAILAGVILAHWIKKEDGVHPKWAFVGSVALVCATLVPVLGWFVTFALFLLAFGTLWMCVYEWVVQAHKEKIPKEDSTHDENQNIEQEKSE